MLDLLKTATPLMYATGNIDEHWIESREKNIYITNNYEKKPNIFKYSTMHCSWFFFHSLNQPARLMIK